MGYGVAWEVGDDRGIAYFASASALHAVGHRNEMFCQFQ